MGRKLPQAFTLWCLIAGVIGLVPGHGALATPQTGQCADFHGSFIGHTGEIIGQTTAHLVPGDVVSMNAPRPGAAILANSANQWVISEVSGLASYRVTVADTYRADHAELFTNEWVVSWSCSHPLSNGGIQQQGAQVEGQNSLAAINDILDGVIAASASSSFQAFSANENSVAVMVAPGQHAQVMPAADGPTLLSESPWRMWMAGRYTHASGDEIGDQFNGLFGLSRGTGEASALGLFGGYESFNYTDSALSSLSGTGLSFGGFASGTFDERLRLDARAYTSFMNYSVANPGGFNGAFTAQRLGTSVNASYEFGNGATSIAPFLRGSSLLEWQAAYTDTGAILHPAQTLAQVILAPGLKFAQRLDFGEGSSLTPYIAGEADIILGNANLPGFTGAQGVSGKLLAGAQWRNARGLSLGADASYGGLGATVQSQSIEGYLNIPF